MQYSITLPEPMLAALKDREARYLRIRITYDGEELTFTPDSPPTCDASSDYQKWSVSFKNYGSYQEGLFGDCPAYVDFSHDGSQWIQMFGGYVATEGMSRTKGRITDDYVSMELVDRTKTKGMKRKPPKSVLTGFKVCDPGNPSSSLVHYLGSLMGVDTFDTSSILEEKDVVVIGDDTIWRELQSLRDAFAADMYFDNLRRLRFRSPHDFSWTEPTSEWTFIAHPDTLETSSSSRVIGKIRTVRRDILCNKAESEVEVYEHRTLREVYRNTENWNAEASECYILVKEGESWPTEGVASLKYQDPETSEEYPYAVNVQFPSIGRHAGNDIYYTGGQLSIISFNGSTDETEQEPGASQIILRNTGPTDIIIRKMVIRGEPFYHSKTQKVIERDGSVSDDVDLVEKTIDGKYATSAVQMAKTLKRAVDEGKVRPRRFSFSTIFLPQIQRGMGCTVITDDGESIACRLMTYSHKPTGATLATMRTDVIVDEVANYIPEYNPKVIETPTTPSVPVVGPPGVPGTVTVVQYSLGGPDGPADQSYEIGENDHTIGEDDWVLGEDGWTSTVPTPGAGQFVYMRIGSYAPPEQSWPIVWRVTRLTGEPARGIRLEASSYTIEKTGRGVLRSGNITLRAQLQNVPSAGIAWTSPNATLIDVDAVTKTLDVTSITAESFTVSVSLTYLGVTYTSAVTIAVVYDGEPKAAYFSYHYSQTLPTTTPTGEPLIVGDLLLYVPKDEEDEWIDTDPLFGHTLKWDGDSWESTTDSHSVGMAAKDAFQIARESGKVIFAAVIYTEAMVAANIQAGSGTGLVGSGFRFRAMDDDYSESGSPKVPVFDVWYHDKVLFKVDIETGNIYFGTNFLYDPISEEIRSSSGAFKIDSDGKLSFTDGTADGLTVNDINVESGQFKGQLDTVTIKTLLGSGTYTTPNNYSGNTMATDMFSGIYCAAGAVPIDSLITADGTLNGKTISKVKFYTPYYTYDRWRDGNWLIGYVYYSATIKNFRVDITCTDGTTYTYRVARRKVNGGPTPGQTQFTYPSYPTFSSSICGSLTEGSLYSYSNPYSITALRIKDPTLEELYIYNLPMTTPSESGRIWKDGSGYLRIV